MNFHWREKRKDFIKTKEKWRCKKVSIEKIYNKYEIYVTYFKLFVNVSVDFNSVTSALTTKTAFSSSFNSDQCKNDRFWRNRDTLIE